MSTHFIRFLLILVVCLTIAHAYPSSHKYKWLRERLGHHPHAFHELSSDSIETDLNENDARPIWLFRSRKFCCAPPL